MRVKELHLRRVRGDGDAPVRGDSGAVSCE